MLLVASELLYFRIADKYKIIDRPTERSSHSRIVIRGGGIIFVVGLWLWSAFFGFQYPLMLAAVTLAAGISFVDDIDSLQDGVRLAAQFATMLLLFQEVGLLHWNVWWLVLLGLLCGVGAVNVFNFMDGINGMTAAYSLTVLIPLFLLNQKFGFMSMSLIIVTVMSVLVFSWFNLRPKNQAKCFAGDVGSVGIAYILLFLIGLLIVKTDDITWLMFLIVYGVDGVCTIVHRIMLHENLGEAHRKHAYQLMANELGMGHVKVSLIYMCLQLVISLGLVFLVPLNPTAHWIYLGAVFIVLVLAYVLFMKKYYHLHAEYLESLK